MTQKAVLFGSRFSPVIFCLALLSCSSAQIESASEGWVNQIRIDSLAPSIMTRGTRLIINGDGFVGPEIGTSRLILQMSDRLNESAPKTRIAELLTRDSRQRVSTILSSANFDRLCPFSSVDLQGFISIETVSATSNRVYESARLEVSLQCNRELSPILERVPFAAVHLNDPLIVEGAGILLGEQEGETTALVTGCIKAVGDAGGCDPSMPMLTNEPLSVVLTDRENRRNPAIIIGPQMIGLNAGFFEGSVHLRNTTAAGAILDSASMPLNFQVLESTLSSVNVNGTSLGGYLDFNGNGFLGLDPRGLTTVIIDGYFEQSDGNTQDIRTEIVTQFDSPDRVRYVLNEEDTLGQILKLRKNRGVVIATFTPVLAFGNDERQLPSLNSTFEVRPILQVVHANFLPGFDDALERFGLLEASSLIKNIIIERASIIFQGIGLEVRSEIPSDFALYSQVDLTGFDPNGIGLMGYDNTPGKDVGNERLHDRIGGVHALTQEDGYPGYGGVFLESFFGFSQSPPFGVESHPGASALFDEIFDPVRPESGRPVSAAEASAFVRSPANQVCLGNATNRIAQVNCAIIVLGNLVGGTMAHEIAHSLGLADPEGSLFHNPQPAPNHLMDAGGDRPFEERAALFDVSGEYFCRENYEYLRSILRTELSDPLPSRTPCY